MNKIEPMKKPSVVRQIALNANEQELESLERIKQHYSRTSDADTIRFLIKQADQKILNGAVPLDTAAAGA